MEQGKGYIVSQALLYTHTVCHTALTFPPNAKTCCSSNFLFSLTLKLEAAATKL